MQSEDKMKKKYNINAALLLPQVSPSEAVFGFAGYLLNVCDKVDITNKENMSILLGRYHNANKWEDPKDDFMKRLVTPVNVK